MERLVIPHAEVAVEQALSDTAEPAPVCADAVGDLADLLAGRVVGALWPRRAP